MKNRLEPTHFFTNQKKYFSNEKIVLKTLNEKVNTRLIADPDNKRIHILSIDGGGIRGLIPLSILNEIVI